MNLHGRNILVTGGTSGIGRETALGLARLGANVTIQGKDPARGAEAIAWLKAESGNDHISLLLADFLSQADIRRAAADYRASHDHLDVLVNNAGGVFTTFEKTADGIERTWALNHLSYFLLTHELLDLLLAAPQARIVNVASKVHSLGKIDPARPAFTGAEHYRYARAYCDSKLGNVLFTRALARRLEGTAVTVNCLHPGTVATHIGRDASGVLKVLHDLMQKLIAVSPAKGARTSLHLAASPEVAGLSGRYFERCLEVRPSRLSDDEALQETLWQTSEVQCGLTLS